jgi:quercetin dioxygenase-like cupin family protein
MQAKSTVFIDNDRTRVTEWRFAPGASTGWHRHEYDYVVVPLLGGKLKLSVGDDESQVAELTAGVPYFRQVGVEHDVTNVNDFEYAFIEVEFK